MKRNIYVSVSTDPIKEYQKIVEYAQSMQGKADFLHCDIMDGVFVEKKTYDHTLVKNISQNSLIMLDVHLMCKEPLEIVEDYLKAGSHIITLHYEAFKNKNDIMLAYKKIKKAGALAGVSVSPSTDVKEIKTILHNFDVVLVMSVVPGKSGQEFMPIALDKIRELDRIRKENDYRYKIEVDGGLNDQNVNLVIDAGADMIVSGSYVYNSQNRETAINSLRGE